MHAICVWRSSIISPSSAHRSVLTGVHYQPCFIIESFEATRRRTIMMTTDVIDQTHTVRTCQRDADDESMDSLTVYFIQFSTNAKSHFIHAQLPFFSLPFFSLYWIVLVFFIYYISNFLFIKRGMFICQISACIL